MQENYKFLNISESATDEEVTARYKELKAKWQEDRFLDGEAGNQAAKNLTKLEVVYEEIMTSRRQSTENGNNGADFNAVENALKNGDLNQAQAILDSFDERNAEWHYLQSVVFYKKNWNNESKKQLEIAMSMDPSNERYKASYEKLTKKMTKGTATSGSTYHSGNATFEDNGSENKGRNKQMGGSDGCGDFCSCCATWCLIDTLCNGCCR